jgi:FkbM family methyltransferase
MATSERIDFVKMDVEGSECAALDGFEQDHAPQFGR